MAELPNFQPGSWEANQTAILQQEMAQQQAEARAVEQRNYQARFRPGGNVTPLPAYKVTPAPKAKGGKK